jgi:hypothetical protein
MPLGIAALSTIFSCGTTGTQDAPKKAVVVTRSGTGIGKVSTSGGEISCGTDCSRLFDPGATVTLKAEPEQGSSFVGWGGACSGTGATCEVKLSMDPNDGNTATVDAKFDTEYVPPTVALTVTKSGSGAGKVVSTDKAVDCGATCQAQVPIPSTVTLVATADLGSGFAGWTGACDNQGTDPVCNVEVNLATSVDAKFDKRLCSADSVCWENPLPAGVSLNGVWTRAADDAWAVGENGTALHYDGKAWSQTASGVTQKLTGVYGLAANDVWAVGHGGTVIRWNGTQWATVNAGTTNNLKGVWAADASNVYVVGQGGTLRKWDNTAWTAITLPAAATGRSLTAIHGLSGSNIRVTGEFGTVIRWNGTAWAMETISSSVVYELNTVFNLDATHAWVGGYRYFCPWNGTTWSPLAFPSSSPLYTTSFLSSWASGPEDVWVGAQQGLFIHYAKDPKGTLAWQNVQSPVTTPINGISGSSATNVWAVGDSGTVMHNDGTGWSAGRSGMQAGWNGVWGTSDLNIWAVGGGGTIARWNGGAFSMVPSGVTTALHGVGGSSSSNAWAVGENGMILRWNGSKWASVTSGVPTNLYAVTALSGQDAWAVGAGGKALRWNGSSWSSVTTGTSATLKVLWAVSATDVWAAGDGGTVLRWDGSKWNAIAGPSTMNVLGLWVGSATNVWAVGPTGVYKFDGTNWTQQTTPTAGPFVGVWGFADGTMYVAGNGGKVLRYDGTTWKQLATGTAGNLTRVYGASTSNVFVFGDGGTVLRTGL